ncbi:Cytochrome P450 family protein [Melia azedarach]|uniref:Cytochrome P450 family protein n=2 Tax=Melia azedarach TaxID=155640 RepID=A0ACC1Y3U4_MELAZ|nr:Cytochrome P450 family protein [Melia azedarach]KAJ4718388.1 Cytochrome P450 family protein [Melia azedarach]
MSSMINSQAVVLATAMVVSSTFLFLAFSKPKTDSSPQNHDSLVPQEKTLRSCLYSEEKKRQRKKQKKRVHFAENVKDTAGNGKEYRNLMNKKFTNTVDRICRNEIPGIPANRAALYNGILRDRVHRMQCSY